MEGGVPFHLWVKYLPGINFKRMDQRIQYFHFRIPFAVLDVEDITFTGRLVIILNL